MSRDLFTCLALVLLLAAAASGCELAGGIFKAGMWVGILMVVVIFAVIAWIVGKART